MIGFTKHYGVTQGTLAFTPSYNVAPTQAVPDVFGERRYASPGDLNAPDPDSLFRTLQDPENPAFVRACRSLGVHASPSPGDVVRDEHGDFWVGNLAGWKGLYQRL